MKQLPCAHCHGPAYGRFGQIEEPLTAGRISHFPYRYKCSRCKLPNVLTATEWNRIPELAPEGDANPPS